MTRRILAGLACAAGLAGYLITPQLTAQASHPPAAVHCQTQRGGLSARPWAWTEERICQP